MSRSAHARLPRWLSFGTTATGIDGLAIAGSLAIGHSSTGGSVTTRGHQVDAVDREVVRARPVHGRAGTTEARAQKE
jgi:hypothetical protein